MPSPSTTVIDAHAHVWGSENAMYPFSPHDGLAVPQSPAVLDEFFADAVGSEVCGVLLIQPRVYGYDHAYLFDEAERRPDQVRISVLMNVLRKQSADDLRCLARHPQTAAFRVIALGPRPAAWLLSTEAHRVWDAGAGLGLPVGFLIDPAQLGQVDAIAADHPDLIVVLDHLARCGPQPSADEEQALARLARRANVHIKLSAIDALSHEGYPHHDMWELVGRIYDMFGPDRLLWGSDWPHQRNYGSYAQSCGLLHLALSHVPRVDRDKIYRRTAARLFGFQDVAITKDKS